VVQEPKGSTPHSQQPATGPYHEPVKSNPTPAILPKIHSDPILPPMPWSSEWSLSFRLPHQHLVHFSMRATCPVHLICLDPICLMIFGAECKLCSSSVCNFLYSPITSSLVGPNIFLRTLFSNTLSPRSSLSVRDQVSHLYKTTKVHFPMFRLCQTIHPGPRLCVVFHNKHLVLWGGLLAPRPSTSWKTAHCRLSATAYSACSQLPSIAGDHFYPQPEDAPCCGDSGLT
jgi:hypothetical protein